jgi:hypothetical protein
MPLQPWSEALAAANRSLRKEQVLLMGEPVKLKVRHKPLDDGSRAIDAVGFFDGGSKATCRSLGVSLTPGNYEIRLPEAIAALRRLVERSLLGEDTRSPRGWGRAPLPTHGALAVQMEEVRRHLTSRSVNLGRCRERQLKEQLRWMKICAERAEAEGRELSVGLGLRALRDFYGGVERPAYKKAVSIVCMACKHLGLPDRIPEDLMPRHRAEIPPRTDIPDDQVIAERLKAIQDPYQAQLVYSVVAYGRRVAEIYYANWPKLRPDGDLPVYSAKTGKRGMAWTVPFGDEQIDLQGFRPPRWDELKSIDKKPDNKKEALIKAEASSISRLIKNKLGCTATDLRHRWAIVCLTTPSYQEDAMEIASAMGTSIKMFEDHYVREMREYRQRRKRRHG